MKQTIWINLDEEKVDISYLKERLSKKYHFIAKAISANQTEEIIQQANQADVVISILEKWDTNELEAVKGHVKLIQKYGMGLDNINLDEAAKRGISVANILGANSASVAEVALLHILNVGRKFTPCVMGVKQHIWPSTITGTELDGKTIGLMGFGNIAKHLARMLRGFEVSILVFDPFVLDQNGNEDITFVTSKEELFEKSDIVSLHIPCTNETKGSINQSLFQLMKKGSYLINTCRGGVINEDDLLEALLSGQIAAAGLDVLTEEPPQNGHPLLQLDQVFVTSHMGAESVEAGRRSQIIMSETIEAFLEGETSALIQNAAMLKKYKEEGLISYS